MPNNRNKNGGNGRGKAKRKTGSNELSGVSNNPQSKLFENMILSGRKITEIGL